MYKYVVVWKFHCANVKLYEYIIAARIGRQTELSNGCIVGAKCILLSHEMLPENTVIYGTNCQRRQQAEKPGVRKCKI